MKCGRPRAALFAAVALSAFALACAPAGQRQSQGYIDLSIFVIDQLKEIGIKARVAPRETAQAYDLAYKGDFDLLTWSHGFALDDPDAVYNEFYLCNAPRNWSRLCTDSVDQLFMKQSQETDPAKRKQFGHGAGTHRRADGQQDHHQLGHEPERHVEVREELRAASVWLQQHQV